MCTKFGQHGFSSFGDFSPFCFPSNLAKFPFRTIDYSPWGSENRIGSKKSLHTNQFWWAWPLQFWRFSLFFCVPSKLPNFPLRPQTIVQGGQKIESVQNNYASRGSSDMHANQFWWAWPLQFRRFCSFLFALKTAKIYL